MRIYAFTDLHGDTRALREVKRAVKETKPDLVVCMGDLSFFEHELKALLSRVNILKVPVIMLHGNHESERAMRKACAPFSRITFLHKEFLQVRDYFFAAFGGGGFEERYPELEELLKRKAWKLLDWSRTVFLSHAPPYGTTLDDVGDADDEPWHVGSKSLQKLVKAKKPLLVLAGHIHECFETSDTVGPTLCENPGPVGRLYDLDALSSIREEDGQRKVFSRRRKGKR